MVFTGRTLRKTAPAAADLQDRGFRFVEFRENSLIFVLLRLFQSAGACIERRRIGHAAIKPQRVELIAHIIVRLDVAGRSGNGISPHQGIVDDKTQAVEEISI